MKLLTPKEAKFIEWKLKGQNNTEAAISAGYSVKSARITGSSLMQKPHIREAIGITTEQLGITFYKAVKPITDALEANKISTDKDSGEHFDSGIPDHGVRLKASAMALDLLGMRRSLKIPESQNTNPQMNSDLAEAMKNNDTIELQRIAFSKTSDEQVTRKTP